MAADDDADGVVNAKRANGRATTPPIIATSPPPPLTAAPNVVNGRQWQRHTGRNRFLCCGRLVMSRSNGAFFVTLTLMFVDRSMSADAAARLLAVSRRWRHFTFTSENFRFLTAARQRRSTLFSAAYVAEYISIAVPIVASVLFVAALANLLRTAFSDPGILPRAASREVFEHERLHRLGECATRTTFGDRRRAIGLQKWAIRRRFCRDQSRFLSSRIV